MVQIDRSYEGIKIVCHFPLNMNVQDYSQKALNDSKTSHILAAGRSNLRAY